MKYSPKEMSSFLNENSFNFKKKFGQNFIIDENIIENTLNLINLDKDTLVIEVGPGAGSLTYKLASRAKKVICYEIDTTLKEILSTNLHDFDNVDIIYEDFLKRDVLKDLANEDYKKLYVVANLPYYITTPIIMKLLEERLDLQSITVMVQKEVAERLIAVPGEKFTGAITYSVYYYADSENVRVVDKSSFIPEPSVESEVINLKIRENPPVNVNNEELFFKLIKIAFMQRRKTLVNSLSNSGFIEKNKIIEILKQLNINENIRAEKLSIQDFANIANKI